MLEKMSLSKKFQLIKIYGKIIFSSKNQEIDRKGAYVTLIMIFWQKICRNEDIIIQSDAIGKIVTKLISCLNLSNAKMLLELLNKL